MSELRVSLAEEQENELKKHFYEIALESLESMRILTAS